jgi:chloramphenicol-sensitive protein RarD
MTPAAPRSATRTGALYALAAYGTWGLMPVYWRAAAPAGDVDVALEMVAHRSLWSLVLLLALLGLTGRLRELGPVLRAPRRAGLLLGTGALLAANWCVFIWAITHGRVVESSLGYYVNPLVMVVLGVVFLKERLRPRQGIAVLLAAIAVVTLAVMRGAPPWIALALALSFGFYGLLRKVAHVDALVGLTVETLLLAPFALALLAVQETRGAGTFLHQGWARDLLLVASGPVTAFPLLWFAHAARRLRYATLGQFQYLTPTCHFLLAMLAYGEALTTGHIVAFALIAVALALYSWDSAQASRSGARAPAPAVPPD